MKHYFRLLPLVPLYSSLAFAQTNFRVEDIRVEGIQRVSAGSIFATLPFQVGDNISSSGIGDAIRTLFSTGNFDDIKVGRDGNVVVVQVKERPSITEINIEGNKAIPTDSLKTGLSNSGLSEGNVLKRSTLEGMRTELTRQYVSQGRYDASINTEVIAMPRNRVAVNIDINEGNTAKIKHINIIGNTVFSDEELLDLLKQKKTGMFSWITSNDKYSKEKFTGDIDILKSKYMDAGYLQFDLKSVQVAVTPQKDAVYITLNIDEGEIFKVNSVSLSGNPILEEATLAPFIFAKAGETFSQAKVTATEEWISKRLGNDGYHYAKVRAIPEVKGDENLVDLKFFIDPGKRTYVRRIEFAGNTRTADEVLRREMRQMEGAPAVSSAIEQSRVRLNRLGYFKGVEVDTAQVPGRDDMIDIKYSVEEQPSGSIGASIGYSQDSGILLGANLQQDNFLGSGKSVSVGVNRSKSVTSANFSYVNPYFTEDGVSRGFSVFYRKTNLDELNISSYTTSTYGASVNFGYPISETQRLGFSLGYSNTKIETGQGVVQEILASPRPYELKAVDQYFVSTFASNKYTAPETLVKFGSQTEIEPFLTPPTGKGFLDTYGDSFDNYTASISWTQSSLNRGRFATRGMSQRLGFELAVPGSDTEYYKLNYNGQIFMPITDKWVVRFRTELGYGDGYSDIEQLPFYQHFYAGGFGSVRGFKSNTLGPRSTPSNNYRLLRAATAIDANGKATALSPRLAYRAVDGKFETFTPDSDRDPFGGNILVDGSVELIFPLPFIKDQRSIRTAFFVDAGNVFSSDCGANQANCSNVDLGELRYSFGVGLSWLTAIGPLTFSYALPFEESQYDDTEAFQFSLGRSF